MPARRDEQALPDVLWAIFRGGAIEASRLQTPSLILLALSLADIAITFLLLTQGYGFYESNPIADWFLARWNFRGMFFFKLASIACAVTLGEIIERHRPGWGRLVLWLGCLATVTVVWHGLRLYLGAPGLPLGGGGGD